MSEERPVHLINFPSEDGGEYDFIGIAPKDMSTQDALALANAVIKTHNKARLDAEEDEGGDGNGLDLSTMTQAIRAELVTMGFAFERQGFEKSDTVMYDQVGDISDYEQTVLDAWSAKQAVNKVLARYKP